MEANFPLTGNGVSVTATVTSQTFALPSPSRDAMIFNPGPKTVRARAGGPGVSATANSMPIPPGEKGSYSIGYGSTHVAVIAPDGDQSVEFFFGEGS